MTQLFADVRREAPRCRRTPSQDRRLMRAEGLEHAGHASRGALFNIIGNGAGVFDADRVRAVRATTCWGSTRARRPGRQGASVRVEVTRGVTVASRRALVTSSTRRCRGRDPRGGGRRAFDAAADFGAAAARRDLLAARSRSGTGAAADSRRHRHRLRGAAERDVGYTISDATAGSWTPGGDTRLPPIMNGVPSALQFTGGASLPPRRIQVEPPGGGGMAIWLARRLQHPIGGLTK